MPPLVLLESPPGRILHAAGRHDLRSPADLGHLCVNPVRAALYEWQAPVPVADFGAGDVCPQGRGYKQSIPGGTAPFSVPLPLRSVLSPTCAALLTSFHWPCSVAFGLAAFNGRAPPFDPLFCSGLAILCTL